VLSPLGSGSLELRQALLGGSSQLSLQTSLGAFPATWSPGAAGASSPVSAFVQQLPPSVTLTAPDASGTLTGVVTLTAVVDDDQPLSSLQFLVDGVPVGPPLRMGPFVQPWDTSTVAGSGPHIIAARATDVLGRTATSASVSVRVDNGPTISQVVAERGLTASSIRVRWSTDVLADSQVEYGTTTAYGLSTPQESTMEWTHEQQLTGLQPGTTYHLRVRSRDTLGAVATSADVTFTTPPPGAADSTVTTSPPGAPE
jgi:hypothetical protein